MPPHHSDLQTVRQYLLQQAQLKCFTFEVKGNGAKHSTDSKDLVDTKDAIKTADVIDASKVLKSYIQCIVLQSPVLSFIKSAYICPPYII